MAKKKNNSVPRFQFRMHRTGMLAVLGIVGGIALLSVSLVSYTLAYKDQVYPNTYIGTTDFGGKTVEETKQLLKEKEKLANGEIIITIDDQKETVKARDLDITYNSDTTADRLYAIGRVGTLTQNLGDLLVSLFSRNQVVSSFSLDDTKTKAALERVSKEVGTQAQDARVTLKEDNTLTVVPAKTGNGVAIETLDSLLREKLGKFENSFATQRTIIDPKVSEAQAQEALTKTQNILNRTPITVSVLDTKNTVDTKTVFSWLKFELTDQNTTTLFSPSPSPSLPGTTWRWLAVDPAQAKGSLFLVPTFDSQKVKDYVANFATGINKEPENATIQIVDGQVKVTKEHVDGQRVHVDDSAKLIIDTLQNTTTTKDTVVTLPMQAVSAQITSSNIQSLGIKELIGRAETNFKGSPANRIHNIKVGTNFLNGVIIAPGEEFSTIKQLGEIDGSTGYLPELVIKENRTIPEFGGGLCQVSTTLFRSALNAGLKITERSNHSYRVSYYEPPVGLDATIYFPKPDFKFVNDTPGYILAQGKVEGTKITFELYGTKDGRVATVSEPTITNVQDPPPDIYSDTDTLPKGETKQIEKAHPGATTVVTYTVTRDGKEINKQIFRSRYKAWAARFLVGTRE